MKITLREWLEMHQLATVASDHVKALSNTIDRIMFAHLDKQHNKESELLARIGVRIFNIVSDICPYLFGPQEEWLGGNSSDPRNFTVREPNWVHMGHRFPEEQVDPFRNIHGKVFFPIIRDGKNQPGTWDTDAEFTLTDWQREVAEDHTRLGYWDWVKAQREAATA